jgi:hypothetical protein
VRRTSVVFVIVIALMVIGVVVFLVRPHPEETGEGLIHQVPAPSTQPATAANYSSLANCLGPANTSVPLANLTARHQHAHALLLRNQLDSAIPELRNIAAIDPGYPAINLEISDALLKSKHANESKDAIKTQLDISGCLADLAPAEVQTYCRSEWTTPPAEGCAGALAKIHQEAQYQAGLVDAELRHSAEPRPAAPMVAAAPVRVTPAPAPAVVASVAPAPAAAPPVTAKPLPAPIIKGIEAADHIGQRATVCGDVVSKKTSEASNGKPTFINLDRPFPNQTFTIVYWDADAAAVGDFPGTGGVCVTGTIATYRGTPQIVVHDAKSWYRPGQ